jgi:hypothetical protein
LPLIDVGTDLDSVGKMSKAIMHGLEIPPTSHVNAAQ